MLLTEESIISAEAMESHAFQAETEDADAIAVPLSTNPDSAMEECRG